MAKKSKEVLVVFDPVGNTLDVWFGEPREAICEEPEEEFLIKKDVKTGEVVGFEKFNVQLKKGEIPSIKFLVKPSEEEAVV
ncbi:MAG: hypothetical protein V3T58_03695 [Candidatus Hydrothermarchaeales archaeon]